MSDDEVGKLRKQKELLEAALSEIREKTEAYVILVNQMFKADLDYKEVADIDRMTAAENELLAALEVKP